jgi:hypothetical protein
LVVNRHGVLIRLSKILRPADEITITNLQTKESCPFSVVEQAEKNLSEGPEWGVACLEPDRDFRGVYFPRKSRGTGEEGLIDALLECGDCYSRELAQLTIEQFRALTTQLYLSRRWSKCGLKTEWKFCFVEGEAEEWEIVAETPREAPAASASSMDKRRERRVLVKLPLRVRHPDGRHEESTMENCSERGASFISILPQDEGEIVYLTFGDQTEAPARVVWRRGLGEAGRTIYGVKIEKG